MPISNKEGRPQYLRSKSMSIDRTKEVMEREMIYEGPAILIPILTCKFILKNIIMEGKSFVFLI